LARERLHATVDCGAEKRIVNHHCKSKGLRELPRPLRVDGRDCNRASRANLP
jgi:hypothetical protein